MKPLKTKQQIREELEKEIASFLQGGGVVRDVPRGLSGNTDNQNLFGLYKENETPQSRTLLNDVVQTLESRKKGGADQHKTQPKRPRKKLIKDDFGEPLRWVWIED